MNSYELLYILNNDLADDAKDAVIEKLNAVVTGNGGTVDNVEKWGTRRLAYPINYKNEGFYVLVNFSAPATLPEELERVMRINQDAIIRFLIVRR